MYPELAESLPLQDIYLVSGCACLYVWFLSCRTVGPSCLCSWARSLPFPLSAGQLTSGHTCPCAWPLLQNAGPWPPQGRPRVWTSGVGSQSAACHPPGRFRAHAWARPFKLHCFLDFGGVVTLSSFRLGHPRLAGSFSCPAFQMLWSHETGGLGDSSDGRGDPR